MLSANYISDMASVLFIHEKQSTMCSHTIRSRNLVRVWCTTLGNLNNGVKLKSGMKYRWVSNFEKIQII